MSKRRSTDQQFKPIPDHVLTKKIDRIFRTMEKDATARTEPYVETNLANAEKFAIKFITALGHKQISEKECLECSQNGVAAFAFRGPYYFRVADKLRTVIDLERDAEAFNDAQNILVAIGRYRFFRADGNIDEATNQAMKAMALQGTLEKRFSDRDTQAGRSHRASLKAANDAKHGSPEERLAELRKTKAMYDMLLAAQPNRLKRSIAKEVGSKLNPVIGDRAVRKRLKLLESTDRN